ncbi:MAG: hypothetical protein GC171_10175 [Terrimonas sp.]|nr:hypothetical protein [Terrimonas sp.]
MKAFILAICVFPLPVLAQQYYHDISATEESNRQFQLYLQLKVVSITATGYNQDNRPVSDFSEKQVIDADARKITTTRNSDNQSSVETLFFDEQNRLIQSVDSSSINTNTTRYVYDVNGRVSMISNNLLDTAVNIDENETHTWIYDEEGLPQKMIRVVNINDTTEFRFKTDANGHITEETTYKRGRAGEVVYYYYNDKGQLTDIVRYNTRARRLLPDFMFEYGENGKMIQKISTVSNPRVGYIIWRYQFDSRGLKIREANFTKEKKLIGRIDYAFSFAE